MKRLIYAGVVVIIGLAVYYCGPHPNVLRLKFDSSRGYQAGPVSPYFLDCVGCQAGQICFLGKCCLADCKNKCGGVFDGCGGICADLKHCSGQGPNAEGPMCVKGQCCLPDCTDKCGGADNGCQGKCEGLDVCQKKIHKNSKEQARCNEGRCCTTACQDKYNGAKDGCGGLCSGRPARVLIFGDSMVNAGPQIYLKDYFVKAGNRVWSYSMASLSTVGAASTPRYKKILGMHNPDIVIIILGSNELFIPYPEHRRKYIEKLVGDTGNRACYWIGPPNWKKDTGLNDVLNRYSAPCKYFNSSELTIERQPDKIHPDMRGGRTWSDEIWKWFNENRP